MPGLDDFVDDSTVEELHLMQIEYEEKWGEPLVHLWARDEDGEKTWVEVEGHRPSFYIHEDAYSERIKNHDWVRSVEPGHESIQGDSLVRIETQLPKHVGGGRDIGKPLRDYFDQTWEADIWYANRFLIDTGIKTHFRVDTEDTWDTQGVDGDYRVHVDDIEPVGDPSWRAAPRGVTADIEVESPDGFPEAEDANQPVTAITAHDSHTDGYTVWTLRHESWVQSDTEIENIVIDNRPDSITVDTEDGERELAVNVEDVRVFENESQMLHDFNTYVDERSPDLLSGWNSSATDNGDAFDYPYLINRCKALNTMSFREWSPMGQVWTTRRGTGELHPGAKGVGFFDMIQSYKKTRWSKPKGGYSLENIADIELPLSEGKLEIGDLDNAWRDEPATFLEYNMRDVQAVVGIDVSGGVTDLYQNLRALTGAQFGDCHNNIDLLDVFILRYAKDMGMALPTNEKPDRDWYYGAYVFPSKPGRHRNVIYYDVSSLYPNIMYQTNISPETIVGTAEELAASEYTEDDCCWAYVDTRDTNVKKNSDPEYERMYYLKPSVKEGFIRSVIDELLTLKSEYDGTELYAAVKRIVNSVYGCMGDSNSYNKGFRLYDWRIAESVTLQGRRIIKECANWGTDQIDRSVVTNGDTDGVGITMGDEKTHEEVVETALAMQDDMSQYIQGWCEEQMNIEESTMVMEAEKLMDPLFIPDGKSTDDPKKRYAYLKIWEQ